MLFVHTDVRSNYIKLKENLVDLNQRDGKTGKRKVKNLNTFFELFIVFL